MKQKMHRNMQSVNVCRKCKRVNLHYDAFKSGYTECPECIHQENVKRYERN